MTSAPGYCMFQLPSAIWVTAPLVGSGTLLMSSTIRFGMAGLTSPLGVERNNSARLALAGSTHRNISCGFIAVPAADLGTNEDRKTGLVGSVRSKNFKSNG